MKKKEVSKIKKAPRRKIDDSTLKEATTVQHSAEKELEKEIPFQRVTVILNRVVIGSSLAVFGLSLLMVGLTSFAQNDPQGQVGEQLREIKNAGINLGSKSVGEVAGNVIQVVLGLLGVVFVVLMVYGGFLWMTSAGEDKKLKKARDTLTQAVIGVAVVIAAQLITYWVLYQLSEATIR